MPVLTLPGFVDAHCHAFQYALRGKDRGGDFWAWREEMLRLAASLTVADVRREYAEVYRELRAHGYTARRGVPSPRPAEVSRELRANGYTAVGEFHYLGLDEARAAADAAAEARIELTLIYACYVRGGIDRFRQASVAEYLRELEVLRGEGIRVGVAPHSVRACP